MAASSVISHALRRGVVNLPGAGAHPAKLLAEDLLFRDAQNHHCYFNSLGLHNHLSHHILAAYDLGAPAGLLQKIYDDEHKSQRPIFVEEKDKQIHVTSDNWTQYLGNQSAYASFFDFFQLKIKSLGVSKTLEAYVFDEPANRDGALMLTRLMSGVIHPFIQVGYGLEFGNETLVATGLAQTAIHSPRGEEIFQFGDIQQHATENQANAPRRQPTRGPSILEIIREYYDSSILTPAMPYDPDAVISKRLQSALKDGRAAEIRRLCSRLHIDDSELDGKIEECVFAAVLLMFATGRPGREIRLDFFLMHLVTSSIFLKSYVRVLENPSYRATLVRCFVASIIFQSLARGRPIIRPDLVMSRTEVPRPPGSTSASVRQSKGVGDPAEDSDYDPWPAMITDTLHAPDSHVTKAMRTLVFAARDYGKTLPGGAIGAYRRDDEAKEMIEGTGKVDGTLFVRAAGMMLEYMGWVTHGQKPREDWDRSALGWDDAWKETSK